MHHLPTDAREARQGTDLVYSRNGMWFFAFLPRHSLAIQKKVLTRCLHNLQLVGILCTNAPAIKALFPGWLGGSSVKPSGGASGGSNLVTIGGSGAIKLSSRNKKSKMGLDTAIIYENDSEERIICEDAKGMALSSNQSAQSQGYLQSGTVHTVQTSSHNYQTSNHQASSYQGSSYHGSEERQRSNDFGLHV